MARPGALLAVFMAVSWARQIQTQVVAPAAALQASMAFDLAQRGGDRAALDRMFDAFKQQFGFTWTGQLASRKFDIWASHMQNISRINSENLGWVAAIQAHHQYTTQEWFASRLKQVGADAPLEAPPVAADVARVGRQLEQSPPISPQLDWSAQGKVSAVKDQGGCGSCWAHAAVAAAESAYLIATGQAASSSPPLGDLSEQELIECCRRGTAGTACHTSDACSGGWTLEALNYMVTRRGVAAEAAYPTDPRTVARGAGGALAPACNASRLAGLAAEQRLALSGYRRVANGSVDAAKQALAEGPYAFSWVVTDDFNYYSSGVYRNPNCSNFATNHDMLLVGYNGSDYWIAKNSWGEAWGEAGYVKIGFSPRPGGMCGMHRNPGSQAVYTPSQPPLCATLVDAGGFCNNAPLVGTCNALSHDVAGCIACCTANGFTAPFAFSTGCPTCGTSGCWCAPASCGGTRANPNYASYSVDACPGPPPAPKASPPPPKGSPPPASTAPSPPPPKAPPPPVLSPPPPKGFPPPASTVLSPPPPKGPPPPAPSPPPAKASPPPASTSPSPPPPKAPPPPPKVSPPPPKAASPPPPKAASPPPPPKVSSPPPPAGVPAPPPPRAVSPPPPKASSPPPAAVPAQPPPKASSPPPVAASPPPGTSAPDIEVQLTWAATRNLDLLVTSPDGQVVSKASPSTANGGTLLRDVNCTTAGSAPNEAVQWPAGKARAGTYTVKVVLKESCGTSGISTHNVKVLKRGVALTTKTGVMLLSVGSSSSFTFVY